MTYALSWHFWPCRPHPVIQSSPEKNWLHPALPRGQIGAALPRPASVRAGNVTEAWSASSQSITSAVRIGSGWHGLTCRLCFTNGGNQDVPNPDMTNGTGIDAWPRPSTSSWPFRLGVRWQSQTDRGTRKYVHFVLEAIAIGNKQKWTQLKKGLIELCYWVGDQWSKLSTFSASTLYHRRCPLILESCQVFGDVSCWREPLRGQVFFVLVVKTII